MPQEHYDAVIPATRPSRPAAPRAAPWREEPVSALSMNRCIRTAFILLAALIAVQGAAYAQASIAGVVRDTSGAVLPGVTVEASSPALIEKTRSVVTDGSGQYKIEQLRPGPYTVTFTLTGFNTVKREGIELAGSFAATVSVDMRVGRGGGNDHGDRRSAARGRPERDQAAGARAGGPDGAADRPHAIHRGDADPRHEPVQPGRRRHQHHQHHRRLDDHPRQQRERSARDDRRRVDRQRRGRRPGEQLPAQLRQRAGDRGRLFVGHRRSGDRRRAHQHDSARRRQHVQGLVLRHRRQRQVPGQQLHPGSDRPRPAHAEFDQDGVRRQPRLRRSAAARQGVVLRHGAVHQDRQLRRRHVLQQERRHRERVDLRPGPDPSGVRQRVPVERQPAPDVAGQPEEQVRLLFRRSGPLSVRQRHRDHLARGGDRDQVPDSAARHDGVDLAGQQPPAARGARRVPRRALQVQRHARRRSVAAADHGHRTAVGERGARRPAVSRRRHRRRDGDPAVPEHLRPQLRSVGGGVLRHRHARLQGGHQRHHHHPRRAVERQRLSRQLPLQQRRAQPDHRAHDAVREGAAASRPASACTRRTSGRSAS